MSNSLNQISTRIRTKNTKNDVYYTPETLAIKQIESCREFSEEKDVWYDPFFGGGVYYNNYPTENKVWTEIAKGKDFFSYTGPADIIVSNPPYSMIDPVLHKSISFNPKIISYLLHNYHMLPKRMCLMADNGYYPVKICYVKIHQWFGVSVIITFKRKEQRDPIPKCVVEWDKTIYRFVEPSN